MSSIAQKSANGISSFFAIPASVPVGISFFPSMTVTVRLVCPARFRKKVRCVPFLPVPVDSVKPLRLSASMSSLLETGTLESGEGDGELPGADLQTGALGQLDRQFREAELGGLRHVRHD